MESKMVRVKDYQYEGKMEVYNLDEVEKSEIKGNLNKCIKNGFIAHFEVLNVVSEVLDKSGIDLKSSIFDEACTFAYEYLDNSNITIRGIDGSLSGEIENFDHNPKLGQHTIPEYDEVKQVEILSRADELKKEGMVKSKEYKKLKAEMIKNNMSLASWCVWKYSSRPDFYVFEISHQNAERRAMENSALLSLSDAFDKFDLSRGNKFSTYAVVAMHRGIERDLYRSNQNSYTFINMKKNIEYVRFQAKKDNIEITDSEIYELLGYSPKQIKKYNECCSISSASSLDEITSFDEEKTIAGLADADDAILMESGEIIQDGVCIEPKNVNGEKCSYYESNVYGTDEENIESEVDKRWVIDLITEIMNGLPPRYADIIKKRFGLEGMDVMTLEEISKEYNVGRERIRQIEAKGLRGIRRELLRRRVITMHYSKRRKEWINDDVWCEK